MNKLTIIPHLWFDQQAEEAVELYTSLFPDASTGDIARYTEEGREFHGMEPGSTMTIEFKLAGQSFLALNGGPHFQMNPSISFYVTCESEEEVDHLWNELGRDGQILMPLDKYFWSDKYGWVQDRFGVSWQIALGNLEDTGQKIVPFLMFVGDQHGRGQEALDFYTGLFQNSGVTGVMHHDGSNQEPADTIMHAQFTLGGNTFMLIESALDHKFSFNEAISLIILCDTQDDVDYFWDQLTEGGDPKAQQCGWLKDKFGVSWQVVPRELPELIKDTETERAKSVMRAMFGMKKLNIHELKQAAELV